MIKCIFYSVHYNWVRVRVTVINATLKIFQPCRDGKVYWWRKHEWLEKTTDLSQVTLLHNIESSTSRQYERRTLVAICTDYTGSCKSNYHATFFCITTMTIPHYYWHGMLLCIHLEVIIQDYSTISFKQCDMLTMYYLCSKP